MSHPNILVHSKGPFTLYAMRDTDVDEIDGEDKYDKNNALKRKIVLGKDVMREMEQMEKEYNGCIIFMMDMSN